MTIAMPRIKIVLPETFEYVTEIPVRITDINFGGHVGNDTILSLIHEARVRFLSSFGYSELNIEGAGLIMADAGIEYTHELLYGQPLRIKVKAENFGRAGFDIYYLLESVKDGITTTIAKAKTGMVCFDYKQKKVISLPEEVKQRLC
ncbi:MAG: thioesterase family protein [Flavobacteriaceae bacterium]|jgi:acyl-CoA thioesterase FadM|nr:thioesterase family protein [Flavobacteriaceae bacterium]